MMTAIVKTMAMIAIMIMEAILNADGRNQEEEDWEEEEEQLTLINAVQDSLDLSAATTAMYISLMNSKTKEEHVE